MFFPQRSKIIDTNISIAHENSSEDLMSSHSGPSTKQDCVIHPQNCFPTILLTNLQNIGKPGHSDKTTDLCEVLRHNAIDIGVFTEMWATDAALRSLEADFDNYIMFHSIRGNCLRPSGGLSIFKDRVKPEKNV